MNTPYDTYAKHPLRATGQVVTYAPKYKTYRVRVYGYGEQVCQAIQYGASTAYGPGDLVVVSRFPGVTWVIDGRLDGISAKSGDNINDFDERPLDLRLDVEGKLAPDHGASLSFRPFDKEETPEIAQYPGEVLLQNRALPFLERAWIKIYRFGVIRLQSSPLCNLYLDRVSRTLSMLASRLKRKTTAYSEDIVTVLDGDQAGDATRTQTMKRSVSGTAVVSRIDGRVPSKSGTTMQDTHVAQSGTRLDVGGVSVELDAETDTVRVDVGGVSLRIGKFDAENAAHPTSGVQSPAGAISSSAGEVSEGASIVFGDSRLTLTPDLVEVVSATRRLTVGDDVVLENGGSKFVLTSSSLTIDADSVVVNAQSIDLNA